MAEYKGSCQGQSGSKYDLTLYVKENRTSIGENKSNITIKLYLKRNDGYSASAYNLNESDNIAKITVNGAEKSSRNLKIDTRNNEKVLLISYTGDFTHNSDGSLSLNLGGSFKMKGTSLTGGSVSKTVTFTKIERPSSLSFTVDSVYPLGDIKGNIVAAVNNFSHKITYTLGKKSTTQTIKSGVKAFSYSVPLDWVNEIPYSSKGKISVNLTTYLGSKKLGSKTYTVDLIVPNNSNFKPDFTYSITKVDTKESGNFNEYIKGISKVKVDVKNCSYKYSARLKDIYISVDNYIKKALSGTFDLKRNGKIPIKITLTDSRGLQTIKEDFIDVSDYIPPSLKINSLTRCLSDGTLDNRGTYLKLDYTMVFSSVNSKNKVKLTYKYRQSKNTSWSSETALSESPVVFGGNFLINSSYILNFNLTDELGKSFNLERAIKSSDIPFNIRKYGKGAAFGKFSEKDNLLDVNWDLRVLGKTDLEGEINYKNIAFLSSSNFSLISNTSRLYPFLNICFLRLKLENKIPLSSDNVYTLGNFKDCYPGVLTPLFATVGPGFLGGAAAALYYKTSELNFKANFNIPVNSNIYISGFFISEKN